MKLTNKMYDYIKMGVTIVLPALGTAYGVIAAAWNLPYTEPILATVTAITACGAAILNGISNSYMNGKENRINPSDVDNEFTDTAITTMNQEDEDNENNQ